MLTKEETQKIDTKVAKMKELIAEEKQKIQEKYSEISQCLENIKYIQLEINKQLVKKIPCTD